MFNQGECHPKNRGGNSQIFKHFWQYTACLLLAFFVSVGNVWGVAYQANYGWESNALDGWAKNSATAVNVRNSGARTGKYCVDLEANGSSSSLKLSSVSFTKNFYHHVIVYVKTDSETATVQINLNGSNPGNIAPGTSWTRITHAYNYTSSTGNKNIEFKFPTATNSAHVHGYFDDVVFYTSTNETTDITAPTAATSASATTSEISWTCGSDANTGIQNTLIWKRTGGAANDLTLNNQGNYVVPAEGSTLDQSGHWTLVNASVADDATSYEGTFTPGDVYAIVHRDLAYNYSSPAYVTIPGGAPVVDVTPPTLSSSSPADEATSVALSGNIVLTFSENVSVLNASKFTLSGGAGSLTTASISASGAAVTIPYSGLANSTTYTLSAAASAVEDAAHNANEAFSISFTTICLAPSIAWGTQPAGGEVGDADAVATVTTTPGEQTITWTSSRTAVATVTNGTIHYVAPGFTNISAGFTYSGSDYCEETVSVNKDIVVPISTDATGTNDKYWYYTSAAPNSPDNGLTYSGKISADNGLFGTKLNSDGYAWFAKPAVAGTLRVGAYYSGSSSDAYVVDVYACSSTGTKGDKIESLTISHIGGVSATLDIDAEVEGIYIARQTNKEGVLYFVEFKDATPSCDATAPGDIEKGEASGGTGKITLKVEDDGEPVTGDAWYWQSSASGEDDEDVYDAENGKEVSAAGTYYLRSYNTAGDCWSAAKSVTVDAADLLTAISPTLSYATSNIVVGNTSSPTLEGNTGSGTVTYSLNDVTPAGSLTINESTGVVTAVTVGGTATVTASIAANGNYAAGAANSGTITVVANPVGSGHVLTWPIIVSTSSESDVEGGTTDIGTGTATSTSTYITNQTDLTGVGVKRTTTGKNSNTGKIETPEAYDADKYVSFTFTVASGYQFTPSEVSIKTVAVSTEKDMKFEFSDANGSYSVTKTDLSKDATATTNDLDFSDCDVDFTGTVTVKIYVYGATNQYRLSTPLTITGTIAAEVTKYDLTFAAGTGASGSMSTLKYAASTEVTLPACTFTAPTDKEFDAWVVTKTVGGAAVTVTNGKFTMPAEAVTATATWKDRAKHTDATLSDLTVGGETVTGFAAATTSYNVELPFGTFAAPTVAATATDASYVKSVEVTQAASASGDATVVVTAEDGSTTKTYTVHFSVEASKDIELIWKTSGTRCGGTTTGSTAIKSNDASVSTYINPITFTGGGEEGSSLNVAKKAGNMLTLSAKPGFAIAAMSFYGKIESDDAKLEYSLDGGSSWNDLASTSGDDACYSDVFTSEEVHTLCMRSAGNKGFWIRNMQLTMIQACTPKTIAWTTAPATEYEVGKSGYAIAASANNGTVSYAASGDAITVNASTGALTINSLTNDIDLSASVAAGDGTTYCATDASVVKEEIKTYYLVKFDAQNETAVTEVKYYSGDAAIALPSTSYSGYVFQGWFDASTGGNKITEAVTPSASRTIYAQWIAQCAGPTITTQPASANYFVDRAASALTCEATPGVEGKALTYTWYSCDDAVRTNPVALEGAPTPSTAAVGTFYYYCAVTEADCDVVRNSNVATVTVTEKDMLLLIQANHVKGGTANMSGYIGGTYRKNMQDNSKFGSKGHYFGIKLASGTFQAGDRVYVHTAAGADTNGDMVRIFKSNVASAENVLVAGPDAMVSPNGDNWVTLPATTLDSLYLRRGTDAENYNKDWNPYIDIFAVYRAYPVPVVAAMTVNGSAASIAGTNITATIAANAELASVTLAPTFMSNDPTLTNGVLGDWSEVSTGVYTASYVVTDKDGDTNTYLITLTRDVAITSITISGETSVAEDAQITLTATVLPANVSNKEVTWTISDETKAVVDANGVVTGKAAGAVTITATSVADNTKFGTYNITVTGYVGTKRVYWFAYAADATANGVTNNSTVFGSAPTGSNSGAKIVTLEEGWVVNTTKYAGGPGSTGTFVVPEGYTATFYAAVKGSGSSGRYVQLKQGDAIKYTSDEFGSADPQVVKIDGVAAGTYTIAYVGGMSNFYLYAAELNRYAITSVTLESGFLLRTEDSRTPAMTIVHAKAAIASQTWSIVSSTATGTTIDGESGLITAGTTPGTITVQVVVEDAMGNEVTSNTCTVEIVEMFERIDVTGSMTWNWNELSMSNVNVSASRGLALANYIDGEKWKMLNGADGDYAYRSEASGCYEAMGASSSLSFHTTVPGIVKITGRRRSNDAVVKINGEITVGTVTSSIQTFAGICVAPGEVTITPDANGMRITKIEFDTNLVPSEAEESTLGGYEREVNPQYYGTICLPKAGVMTGALLFQIAYMDYKEDGVTPYKVYYDQVEGGIMEAGMPYIFLAEESTVGVFYSGLTEEEANHFNGLHGTLENITSGMDAEGRYMLYNNKVLHSSNPASSLMANRAYIQIDEIPGYNNPSYAAPAPKYRRISTGFNGANTATGMDQITNDQLPMTNKVIIDGRLFILRGEKMYDATGRLVK